MAEHDDDLDSYVKEQMKDPEFVRAFAEAESRAEAERAALEDTEQTFLVAFEILATDRAKAMKVLDDILDGVNDRLEAHAEADREDGTYHEISWWVAEDDRTDRSDNDSAVFVTPGKQAVASRVLSNKGYTPRCNVVPPEQSDAWKANHG